jgi:hypothetical protein
MSTLVQDRFGHTSSDRRLPLQTPGRASISALCGASAPASAACVRANPWRKTTSDKATREGPRIVLPPTSRHAAHSAGAPRAKAAWGGRSAMPGRENPHPLSPSSHLGAMLTGPRILFALRPDGRHVCWPADSRTSDGPAAPESPHGFKAHLDELHRIRWHPVRNTGG